jgi:hypothetical protein
LIHDSDHGGFGYAVAIHHKSDKRVAQQDGQPTVIVRSLTHVIPPMLCEPSLYSILLQRIAQMVNYCFVRLLDREVSIMPPVEHALADCTSVQCGPYKLLNRAWIDPV